MNNQDVGQLSQTGPFTYLRFLLTLLTHEVIDCFSCYELIQTLVERWKILHLQGQVVVVLEVVAHISTSLASELLTHSPSEDARQ